MATAKRPGRKAGARPKRGEAPVMEFEINKEEFERAPREHRQLFLHMGHLSNEARILQTLLGQALWVDDRARANRDSGFGTCLLLVRLLCGRLFEANKEVLKSDLAKDFIKVGAALPADSIAVEPLKDLSLKVQQFQDFLASNPLIGKVRNKLAFHADKPLILEGYDLLADDMWPLVNFHTRHRGGTFFGGSDLVATLALSHLLGDDDPKAGVQALMDASIAGARLFEDVVEGYMVAFVALYLHRAYTPARTVTLTGLPTAGKPYIRFFQHVSPRDFARYCKE